MNHRGEESRREQHGRWEREHEYESRFGRGGQQSGYQGSSRWQSQGQGQYGRGQGEYYGGRQFGERMQGDMSGERMRGGMQGAGWDEEGNWEYEGGPERFSGYSESQRQRPLSGQREFGVYGGGSGDYYAGRQGFGARGSFGSEFSSQGRGGGYGEASGYMRPRHEQERGQGQQWRFGGRGQVGGGYRPQYGTSSVYGGESAGFGGRASLYGGRSYRDEGEMSGYGGSELYSQELRSESSGRYGTSPGQYGYGGYGMERHFRGKGPRSFTRSDERITEEINERLTDDDDLDASEINVRVADGKVTLEGSVDQRWMKHRAEDIADSCMGVKDVDNRIQIKSSTAEMGEQRGVRTTGKTSTSTTTGATSTGTTGTSTGGSTTPH